jgi:hypothetical protein
MRQHHDGPRSIPIHHRGRNPNIGVFLKLGLNWRHYRGTDLSDIELVEPGHKPVLVWRSPGLPA